MNLIPVPPSVPSPQWLRRMAVELMRRKPALAPDDALRCAELAHDGTWLLEPEEAASWWLLAIDACARQRSLLQPGLPG